MDWATLFERAEAYETDLKTIRDALDARRTRRESSASETSDRDEMEE